MFWIFLLFIVLMVLACYVTYKEAKHHELHKMRACFVDMRDKVTALKESDSVKDDKEAIEIFEGEILGLDRALELVKEEDADCDLIQEIEDDLKMVKGKVASLFKKKDIA